MPPPRPKHAGGGGAGGALLGAFIVHEEECFVAFDRTAKGSAEDVAAQGIAFCSGAVGKESVGIQLLIAKELENIPVELVGEISEEEILLVASHQELDELPRYAA